MVLASTDAIHWDVASGIAILGLGAVLIAASFAGGARWLIIPGLLLAGAVGFLKAADVHLRGGWGDRDIAVASVADLHDRYDLSAGRLRIDLRDLRLAGGEERSVRARVGMGDLVIRVPQGVTVDADARSGAGQVELFGRQSDGLDVTRTTARDLGFGGGTLHLDADVVDHPDDVVLAGDVRVALRQPQPQGARPGRLVAHRHHLAGLPLPAGAAGRQPGPGVGVRWRRLASGAPSPLPGALLPGV